MLKIKGPNKVLHEPSFNTTLGTIFNVDCKILFKNLKDNSIDCIFADPPFNLQKDYGKNINDNMKKNEYLSWCREWLDESVRVLKDGGALFIYNIPMWLYQFCYYLDDKLIFRNWIALTMKNTYPRGNKLYPAHYGLIYFTKNKPAVFNKLRVPIPVCRHCKKELKDYGGHRDKLNPKGLNLTDFWEDTSPVRHSKFKTRGANELKPIIPRRAIMISTNKDDIILDPFGGGGSTYQEAQDLGRYWLGSEIGDIKPIKKRLSEKFPLFVSEEPPERLFSVFKNI